MRCLPPVISLAFAAVAMSLASCVTLFEPDLWYAALMKGHGDVAFAQARRVAERVAEGKSVDAEFLRALPLLTLLRLERWDEVLQAPPLNGDAGLATGLRDQARGVRLRAHRAPR